MPGLFQRRPAAGRQDAGRIASLEVLRIINEPTAAALAYGLDKQEAGRLPSTTSRRRHVRRLHPEIGDGVFEVKSTNGDTFLGGEDFDMRLVDYLATSSRRRTGIDSAATSSPCSASRSPPKRRRSSCPRPSDRNQPALHHRRRFRPEASDDEAHPRQVRGLVDDLVQRTVGRARTALRDANLKAAEIDEVVLVGGMTRMPKIGRR